MLGFILENSLLNYRDYCAFLQFLALFFWPLPPIKNYIFGISRNRAVRSKSFGLIL